MMQTVILYSCKTIIAPGLADSNGVLGAHVTNTLWTLKWKI